MLDVCESWLDDMLGRVAGVAITITRDSKSVSITAESGDASVGREVSTSERDSGGRKEWSDRDYFVRATAYAPLGEPEAGDLIRQTINGTVRLFKVFRPDTGERPWRWWDTGGTIYRLHTKKVG